jgi:hypothetical protein
VVEPRVWRQVRSALVRMPRSGQRSVARVAARRAGLLDRERIERVVERGRVAVGWEPCGQKMLLKKGPSCPPGSKVHGMRQ